MEHDELARHLQLQELYLLHHNHSESPQQLDSLIADEFREITADGRVVEREPVIEWLMKKDPKARWAMEAFEAEQFSASLVLLTYRARQVEGMQKFSKGSWRTSLWHKPRGSNEWRLRFHQASPIKTG